METFGSYRIGTTGAGSNDIHQTPTSGTGGCTGSFGAPDNITGAGTFFYTLYLSSGYNDPYGFIEFQCNGGSSAGDCLIVGASDVTRVISLVPSGGATTSTSTASSFTVTGFIHSSDFATGTVVRLYATRDATTQSVDVIASLDSVGGADSFLFEFYPTSAGNFSFSSTTDTSDFLTGQYSIVGSINFPISSVYQNDGIIGVLKSGWSRLMTLFEIANGTIQDNSSPQTIIKTSTFVIGTLNYWDITAAEIVSMQANLAENSEFCSPFSGDFSMIGCLSFLFRPNEAMVASLWNTLYEQILSRAPFGYITRFVAIASGLTSTQPVPLSYTFGTSAPDELQGLTYSVQIFDHFDILNSLESDDLVNPKTIWEITMPFFEFIVGLGVLGVILFDLLQIGVPTFTSGRSTTKMVNGRAESFRTRNAKLTGTTTGTLDLREPAYDYNNNPTGRKDGATIDMRHN